MGPEGLARFAALGRSPPALSLPISSLSRPFPPVAPCRRRFSLSTATSLTVGPPALSPPVRAPASGCRRSFLVMAACFRFAPPTDLDATGVVTVVWATSCTSGGERKEERRKGSRDGNRVLGRGQHGFSIMLVGQKTCFCIYVYHT